jgi:hypothetical protein
MCVHQSAQQNRFQAERNTRQENPITGQPCGYNGGEAAPSTGRPPSGQLSKGLVPMKGPMDHMTVPNKDVPSKRVDPTKNQSSSFSVGAGCMATNTANDTAPRSVSRITESALCDGFSIRESTPERRRTPGQVVRGSQRPKDNLSSGCLAADRVQDHPTPLLRKPGSCGAGVGTGGAGHLVQGPNGFVPAGIEDFYGEMYDEVGYAQPVASTFRRACGVVAGGAR